MSSTFAIESIVLKKNTNKSRKRAYSCNKFKNVVSICLCTYYPQVVNSQFFINSRH